MPRHNPFRVHLAGMALLLLVALPALLPLASMPPARAAAFCTQQYAPVCAQSHGQRRTYANACLARAAGARVVHPGICGRRPKPAAGCKRPADPAHDPRCKSWTDGCNICRRARPGAPARCTKMACRVTTAPRCLLRFGERP